MHRQVDVCVPIKLTVDVFVFIVVTGGYLCVCGADR